MNREIEILQNCVNKIFREGDKLATDFVERHSEMNGLTTSALCAMRELARERAIGFNNWLAEEGYEFTEVRYKLYLGGKYFWIQDLYSKYEEHLLQLK